MSYEVKYPSWYRNPEHVVGSFGCHYIDPNYGITIYRSHCGDVKTWSGGISRVADENLDVVKVAEAKALLARMKRSIEELQKAEARVEEWLQKAESDPAILAAERKEMGEAESSPYGSIRERVSREYATR
jgi:hypothetical protein